MNAQVQAQQVTGAVEQIENEYHFRKNRDTGEKRPSVVVKFNVPTAEGIVAVLQDTSDENKKTREMVVDQIRNLVIGHLRTFVDADESFTQESLTEELQGKLTLHEIANLPKSERNTISKDDLEGLAAAYVKGIQEITAGTEGAVSQKAAEAVGSLIVARLNPIKGKNDVLKKLQDRLLQFMEGSDAAVIEEHQKAIGYISTKLEEALAIDITVDAI